MSRVRRGTTTARGFGQLEPQPRRQVWTALGRLVSFAERDAIYFRALSAAQLDMVPDSPVAFTRFVLGPVRDQVDTLLGAGAADDFIAEVASVLDSPRSRPITHPFAPSKARRTEDPGSKWVMLVIDDAKHRNAIRWLLSSQGYQVVVAADGQIALALSMRRTPALVVAKHDVPGVDGCRLAALLRLALGRHAPQVALLSKPDAELYSSDANVEVVHEPASAVDIVQVVKRCIGPPEAGQHGGEGEPDRDPSR